MHNKAVFLDKDGTVIPNVHFNVDPDRITLAEGSGKAIRSLREAGFLAIIVTNQHGVAMGYFKEEDLVGVKKKIDDLLSVEGTKIDDFYYCPYHPQGVVSQYTKYSDDLKPHPGMILKAAKKWNIDLSQSWMVGDSISDVEAGNVAGCKTIFITQSGVSDVGVIRAKIPDYCCSSMYESVDIIMHALHIPFHRSV